MSFASAEFAFFLLAAVTLYYIIPKKVRWISLLLTSYVFYLSGGVFVLWYILFTTLTTYLSGCFIGSIESKDGTKEEKAKAQKKKRIIAAACLICNFGLLYFVKYWNFTLDVLNVPYGILRTDLLLPLGISFYIFQSMGYIIDLVRSKYKPQKNPFKLALFVSFFPQLTQGPISRYDDLGPKLWEGNDLSADNLKESAKLLLWGSLKKLVVADRAAVVACAVIDNYHSYSGSVILFGVVFYCLQLYCDFSGGIDIARGAARLFGVDLARNFKRPVFAVSLADFWRRWHITLGSWLRDYLFYPLTLSKPFINLGKFLRAHIKGKASKILPTSAATFIVYFAIGIWHGASWKYILFGVWNGTIITASLLAQPLFNSVKKRLSIKDDALWYKVICVLRTMAIIIIGRYITRAAGVSEAVEMFAKTVTDFSLNASFISSVLGLGLTVGDYVIIAVSALIIFAVELGEEMGVRITERIESKGVIPTLLLVFFAVLALIVFGIFRGNYISSEFIYQQY